MDITQLIADDHTEQRRLFALIDELNPVDRDALQAIWTRLRILLDTHALAEEQIFYPELLKIGKGADDESSNAKRATQYGTITRSGTLRLRSMIRRLDLRIGSRLSRLRTKPTAITWQRRSARVSQTFVVTRI